MFQQLLKYSKLFVAFSTMFFSHAAFSNLIENGGFETPDIETVIGQRGNTSATWQYYDDEQVDGFSGSNIEIWNSGFRGIEAWEGGQFIELNSHQNGVGEFSVFQSFDTEIGQTYELSFAYRARNNSNEAFNLNLSGSSSTIIDTVLDDHEREFWSVFSRTFTAEENQTTLQFTSLTPTNRTVGNFIDGVAVKSVPEIGASGAAIAMALLLGFLALVRERKAKARLS